MRIRLDTDIGSDVDDALALAYSLRHPGLEPVMSALLQGR